ncbi:MAG: lysophospholipid acyltransferase family protein [Solirubrobacteraceae bacterium]|nr:lysophospholipid acyltransferase family protein [Solirubrobacteraceae bacterium]
MTAPALEPLLPVDDPPGVRRRRIAVALVRELGAFTLLTLLAPLVLVGAAAVDAVRGLFRGTPWMTVRLAVLLWWFLLQEIRGLLSLLGIWLLSGGPLARDTPARRRRVYRLQVRWAADSFAAVQRLWGLRIDVAGDELIQPGPVIVLYRHASVIDNALPAVLLSRRHGLDLRYVLKDAMADFPTLDIGARWVPTCFVRRGSDDPAREIAKVRTLAEGLRTERDGVLIFPEGTRFTAAKLAQLRERGVRGAAELHEVLPPRPGGPVALLEAAPHAAVLICGHTGLEGFHDVPSLWGGKLVGARVHVRIWRHEPQTLPHGREELTHWLEERWRELDAWIAAERAGEPPA